AAIQINGGYSIGASAVRPLRHARTSSNVATPRAYPAIGRPGRGMAMVSRSKYQSADGIVAQSAHAPSAMRKSFARYKPNHSDSVAGSAALCAEAKSFTAMPRSDGHRHARAKLAVYRRL